MKRCELMGYIYIYRGGLCIVDCIRNEANNKKMDN